MSLFKRVREHKNELIHFDTLIREIATQELISYPEACGVIAREAAEHAGDVPFGIYEPFYLYKYDPVDGFVRNKDFTTQSLLFLQEMARGEEFELCSESTGVYKRMDGGHGWKQGWYYGFYFKGSELATSFMDAGVTLPPCLAKFSHVAEESLKAKSDKNQRAIDNYVEDQLTIDTLKQEIKSLKNKIQELSANVPCLLGVYREDDPLLLAIHIRNTEWAKFNPENDRATRANQAAIKHELEQRGFTTRQAESIELVACPIIRGKHP
ncbi:hypothetical protein QSI79_22330 [Enterobacter asburiae]|uniref:hypothetical protein n=1 Tax=Enterobacter asburiae TaxID=61645 RepID=UPI002879C75C|nr:hypothetical protein [Enterobacter asburiae]MDS1916031.1 hypothetical protein [Enterobacter asburiae]